MIDAVNELIEELSDTPEALKRKLGDRTDIKPQTAEDWGPVEIIGHMATTEQIQRNRMQEMLTKHVPYLKDWDPIEAARQKDYSSMDLSAVLAEFVDQRGDTLVLLVNLALKDWDRTGMSDTMGEVSLEDLAGDLIDNDQKCMAQIEEHLG
ncbi:MAG: DinB family protein [Sphaerobacteraceae bacterium]|nr:MAG: DinB family protein [Sphaerobacteraceae bacterium]